MSQTMLYLVEGKDLPAMDYTGKSDPFINVLTVNTAGKTRQIYQTETIEQTLNPRWNESVRVKDQFLRDESLVFRFNVYDRDAFSNDYMGHFDIPVVEFKKSFNQWFPLQPKPGKKSKDTSGSVLVKCVAQSDGVDTNKLHTEATQKILAGDEAGAIPLLKQASEHGSMVAQRDLATLLKEGRGVDKDPLEARRLFTRAAKNGDSVSENMLGYMKQNGIGGTKNATEAKEHFEVAANTELPAALYNLGYCLFCGVGAPQDMDRARECFVKAAQHDYPPAMNNLAFCYQFGLGGEKKKRDAEKLYIAASSMGYAPAMVNYGQFLQFAKKEKGEKKEEKGEKSDKAKEREKKAKELYEKALEADSTNAQAWFSLGLCLEMGIGGEANKEQAKKAYSAADKFGEPDGGKAVKRLEGGGPESRTKRRARGKSTITNTPKSSPKASPRCNTPKSKDRKALGVPEDKKKGHRRTRSMGRG